MTKYWIEDPKKMELKKFSLRPEKFDRKGNFEEWVNQFEEYAILGQWSDNEWASLMFLSLTGGAQLYFVGLPNRENMAYLARVEALRFDNSREPFAQQKWNFSVIMYLIF